MTDKIKVLIAYLKNDAADGGCDHCEKIRDVAADALQDQAKEIERQETEIRQLHNQWENACDELNIREARISELEARLSTLERETVEKCWNAVNAVIRHGELKEPAHSERNGMVLATNAIRALIPSDKGEASLTKETANERPR